MTGTLGLSITVTVCAASVQDRDGAKGALLGLFLTTSRCRFVFADAGFAGRLVEWAQAVPRQKEGSIQSLRIGFQGKTLAALEIVDAFGQRSLLQFKDVALNVKPSDERFRFVVPKGADVIEQ